MIQIKYSPKLLFKQNQNEIFKMSNCCNQFQNHNCNAFNLSRYVDCDSIDDCNLYKLKNTNNELKHLINKLEDLSDSIDSSLSFKCRNNQYLIDYSGHNKSFDNFYEPAHNHNSYCTSCEHLDYCNELASLKKDPNIYPLEKYPSGRLQYCDVCETCNRSRSHSRNRSRRNSVSRKSSENIAFTEYKPKWNGGPFKSNYLWRDEKLKESN